MGVISRSLNISCSGQDSTPRAVIQTSRFDRPEPTTGFGELDDIRSYLGITDSVREFYGDPFIENYYKLLRV